MQHQDWNTITLRDPSGTKKPNPSKPGEVKKPSAGGSGIHKIEAQVESGNFEIQTVGTDFKLALLKARQAKGWSQKELAEKINIKVAIITEYEQGKGIPDPAVISKLNRILGVTLPKPPKKKTPKATSDDL